MATRLQIAKIEIARQGGVYHYRGDDGFPAADVRDEVHVQTADGRWFLLPACRPYTKAEIAAYCGPEDEMEPPCGPKTVYWDASERAAWVRRVGSINPDLWVEYEPDTRTLEEKWAEDAEINDQVRAGLRHPDEYR